MVSAAKRPAIIPEFAQFLVQQGIDSISLNPDTVLKTTVAILEKEKRNQSKVMNFPTLLGIIAIAIAPLPRASAHCDGFDGPVVPAARKALETGDVNLVLIWVQKSNEAEVKRAFDHAQAVRKLGAEARELAAK